jgi:hypothetical protein
MKFFKTQSDIQKPIDVLKGSVKELTVSTVEKVKEMYTNYINDYDNMEKNKAEFKRKRNQVILIFFLNVGTMVLTWLISKIL